MHKGFVAISFIGLAVAGYLFIIYTSPIPVTCIAGEGCKAVQASRYSSFFGIPTPAYGIAYYLALGILGALWTPNWTKQFRLMLVILTSSGLAVSVFLSYLEAYVVQAWCSWCISSAILTIIAFALTWKVVSTYDTHI
ncbi:MAG: hypothetical protein A3E36_03645 [Candidatus Andersenbacteria bacterium RIFCSPHIGHO2_12_FULL_45_11b]|uniref:Vitamin K epoxide reductase domain-containing protein n=1 Tax=Candidatus Andersenbacteria bacterium RIFCSPHIGHO2_12_FULL_45_11b TaxID=1797282 RepID=A0A1G1X956_9BACT|nr:MAG: hypothetical protein A3E36_03645 [Candidatus Andersenbacteria bacterium RIFCSPHIGHO2_12_FULL_45_11b]